MLRLNQAGSCGSFLFLKPGPSLARCATLKNQVQLITYVDRLSGDLTKLEALLSGSLAGDVFGGVHLLPFFHPIDGADAGFDPADHTQVDSRLGDWNDVTSPR